MSKIFIPNYGFYLYYGTFALSCLLTFNAPSLEAKTTIDQYYLDDDEIDEDEEIDYASLGEFEEMFREFEILLDQDDYDGLDEDAIVKKWNTKKSIKKWVVKIARKFICFDKISDPEYAAYTAAAFRRKMGKYFKKTKLDKIFHKFDKEVSQTKFAGKFEKLKERIRYYAKHKHARPHKKYSFKRRPEYNGELDHIPVRSALGGVEVFCGILTCFLPWPGCRWAGKAIITHGVGQICEGYYEEYQNNHKKNVLTKINFGTMQSMKGLLIICLSHPMAVRNSHYRPFFSC